MLSYPVCMRAISSEVGGALAPAAEARVGLMVDAMAAIVMAAEEPVMRAKTSRREEGEEAVVA